MQRLKNRWSYHASVSYRFQFTEKCFLFVCIFPQSAVFVSSPHLKEANVICLKSLGDGKLCREGKDDSKVR